MTGHVARWKLWAAGIALYAAVAWWGMPAEAEARQKKGEEKPAGKSGTSATPLFYPASNCENAGCHGGSPPKKWVKDKDLLCRCTEAEQWKTTDKHADAYTGLTKKLGKQMARILGYDVTKAKACLTCHAVWFDDPVVRKDSEDVGFDIKEGVSCVACHGAYLEWIGAHGILANAGKFRPLDRKVKWEKYGMKDLWDPLARAELCTSCHVGNAAEGKFVTHEMYAAGHPPLPGFELATFSNEMPRHWQYLREKKPKVAEELGLRPGELEETQLVLVGAAISLRDAMSLIADDGKKNAALDLSHFDCLACHHDLKADSWRRVRGYGTGKPGRVPMRPWSPELVRLAIKALPQASVAGQSATFEKLLAAVTGAFDAQPYGDAKTASTAAAALARFADGLARKLNRPALVTRKDAQSLLASFPSTFQTDRRLLDHDQARQAAWSFEVIHNELLATGMRKDDKAATALAGIGKSLKLRLPDKKRSLEADYPDALKRMNDYDPRDNKSLLSGLRLSPKGE